MDDGPEENAGVESRRLWDASQEAFKARDYRRAADIMRDLFERYGERARPDKAAAMRLSQGVTLLRLGETVEGVKALERAVALEPNVGRAHSKLGIGLARLRRSKEALVHFQRAVELCPDMAEYHWRLGEELRRMRRTKEARAALEKCFAIEPEHPAAHKTLEGLKTKPRWNPVFLVMSWLQRG